jgi:hypothetical protein
MKTIIAILIFSLFVSAFIILSAGMIVLVGIKCSEQEEEKEPVDQTPYDEDVYR